MTPELQALLEQAIKTWSGVTPPNPQSVAGLEDFTWLLAQLPTVRTAMEFDSEPATFELALQAEKDRA